MSLPTIDFTKIRPHGGSRNDGFEELCAQIAGITERSKSCDFVRTGRGADAGVECYSIYDDLRERGWQAKYVFSWDDGLGTQLDKSINATLEKHPNLTEYIVCLPFNLPEARQQNRKSQREKWTTWKSKWETKAKKDGRNLAIELWDATELSKLLSVDRPEFAGRIYYWFSEAELTAEWFAGSLDRTKSDLGSRYTPESNIELPIRLAFSGCSRDASLNKRVQTWATDILDDVSSINFSLRGLPDDGALVRQVASFRTALNDLSLQIGKGPFDLNEKFPIEDWQSAISEARNAALNLVYWVYDQHSVDEKSNTSPDLSYARAKLGSLADRLARISDTLKGEEWQLVNAEAVLLYGEAGTGKSHLLADVVEHQVHNNRPAILTLGSYLTDGDPWQQILKILDLPPLLRATDFLGALDAAGEAADCRVLFCVDAINERNGVSVWPDRIGSFLKLAEAFPRVVIVVSCRTTYLERIIPSKITNSQLTKIEHQGFATDGGRAASLYLAKRGIVRAGAPNLAPEMHIPLFLKTLCDALESSGQREIPRGLQGISALFEFYNYAVIHAVTKKLDLDPRLNHVKTAIESLVNLLASRGNSYASYADVNTLFETILPSQGSLERGLLPQLESEGILSVEVFSTGEGGHRTDVRFTFERYSDHIIARHLLDEHLDKSNPTSSFVEGLPLGEVAFGKECYRHAGIIEALAIQLPEICGREILDVGRTGNWAVFQGFESSFLWRDQNNFTERTMELVREQYDENVYYTLLVNIATEPKNQFNSYYLHNELISFVMSDRDAFWSVWLMHQGESGDAVMTLIDWALRNGQEHISEERAELAAVALCWFFSCSNREIRDKATKALASILARRLALATKLFLRFAEIDDLYIMERLLAGIYGAVLQGKDQNNLKSLATNIFDRIFASGSPPLNELLRDHARCVLDYASYNGMLDSKIAISDYAPPYRSPWPIEHVSDELIENYRQDYSGAYLSDSIVSSCVSDGDFARYIIDPMVAHFGVEAPDGGIPPSYREQAREWFDEFKKWASEDQMALFVQVLSAAKKLEGKPGYGDSPEHRGLKEANKAFRAALADEQWGEYRTRAKMHVEHGMFSKNSMHRRHAARFDNGWARRWVCKRAHDFGWTSERFAKLEPRSSYDRNAHQIERIGKKYQWLAIHELAARLADNVHYFGSSYGDAPTPYANVRELRLRDMDPSLLTTETYYDSWKEWPKSWWVPIDPKLLSATPIERVSWLRSNQDILNSVDLIALKNPKTGKSWFPLEIHAGWRQSGFEDGERGMLRQTWFRTNCYLVSKTNKQKLLKSLAERILVGQHDLPDFEFDTEFHLGEYAWHPEVKKRDRWSEKGGWHKLPVPMRPLAFDLYRERSSHDYSIDKTINILLPTPWLIDAMQLQLRGGHLPDFVNQQGETIIFDPSVIEPGNQASLVEKDAFCEMLDQQNMEAVWVIAGEKSVYGGPATTSGWGGRIDHTGIYHLKDREVCLYSFKTEPQPPEEGQLLALLKLDKLPVGLEDWVKSTS